MAANQKNAAEIDRLATQLAKDPQSKVFLPLAEEYCKVGMWEEAVSVLEEGLKYYPGFITAMVALGRAYDQLNQPTKARAVLEGAVKLSPDNLRAHRTLIKIYQTQGLTEEVLRSCSVILTMNPRDEEALSIQASLKVQAAPPSDIPSAPMPQATGPEPLVWEQAALQVTDVETAAGGANQVQSESHTKVSLESTPPVSDVRSVQPRYAKTIARLESWLRSIERQRHDRAIPGDRAA
ncbi:tetratricopeptide repeat protein [Petrachloros mirabilis]